MARTSYHRVDVDSLDVLPASLAALLTESLGQPVQITSVCGYIARTETRRAWIAYDVVIDVGVLGESQIAALRLRSKNHDRSDRKKLRFTPGDDPSARWVLDELCKRERSSALRVRLTAFPLAGAVITNYSTRGCLVHPVGDPETTADTDLPRDEVAARIARVSANVALI